MEVDLPLEEFEPTVIGINRGLLRMWMMGTPRPWVVLMGTLGTLNLWVPLSRLGRAETQCLQLSLAVKCSQRVGRSELFKVPLGRPDNFILLCCLL